MTRRTLQAAAAALLMMALVAPTAGATGEAKLRCAVDGVTSITGPTPKAATQVRVDWYDSSRFFLGSEQWLGGAKRFPTPQGSVSAVATFVMLDGTDDLVLNADCVG